MGKICSCLCPHKDHETDKKEDAKESLIPGLLASNQTSKISKRDFNVMKLIGQGKFGKVFLVNKKSNGVLYAMKVMKKKDIDKNSQRLNTINERNILIKCESPFIVQLKFSFQDYKNIYLVMEFVQGGELFYQLRKSGRFGEDRAQFYAAEIILALEFLHKNGIIYRDLKPENVLLDSEGHIKLTDFGLSKSGIDEANIKTFTLCGTTDYLAPEIIKSQGYDKAVDFWSLGAVVYEMIAGLSPFYAQNHKEIYKNILRRNFEIKPYFSQEAADLINKLLTIDIAERTKHGIEVKNHAFFKNIDWKMLEKKEIAPPFKPRLTNSVDLRYFDEGCTGQALNESVVSVGSTSSYLYQDFTYVKDD